MLIPRDFFLKNAAAKGPGRFAMHAMLIEAEGCVTTDGRVLVQKAWPVGLNGDDADLTAIGHALPLTKGLLKFVRGQKSSHFQVSYGNELFTVVSSGGARFELSEDSRPFPDWRAVLPKPEITSRVQFAKATLEGFLAALPVGAVIEFGVVGDKNDKGVYALTTNLGAEIAGLVMTFDDLKERPDPDKYFDRGASVVTIPDPQGV